MVAFEEDHIPLQDVIVAGELTCSLEEAALHVARQEYPSLETRPWLERLDSFADLARPLLSTTPDPAEIIGVVNDVLFRDLGFRGNQEDYYAPRNSFLNDVIELRQGIPISLSVVYMAVARRVGLEVQGTAFPGHFLLRVDRGGWPIILDAYAGGHILSQEDCRALLHRMGEMSWDPEFVAVVNAQYVLRRMLNNLKIIYFKQRDWTRLRMTTLQIMTVTPEDHDEHFTLGIALAGLGRLKESLVELQHFLELRPDAPNRVQVLQMMQELQSRLH